MDTLWRKYQSLSIAAKSAFIVMGTVVLIAAMLTIGYFLVIRASNSATTAQALAAAVQRNQHDICVAGNKDNTKQLLLWQYILKLSPPKTPEQQHLDQQFEAFLNTVFKTQDCPGV